MNDKKVGKNNYIFHTTVSGFSLLLLDLILDPKTYGAVDYRVLYENKISLWYLTKKGNGRAYRIGKKMLDDIFFQKIIDDSNALNALLTTYKSPKINEKNIFEEWRKYSELLMEFCRLYRFYEQPFQQALEERVRERISEKKLVEFFSVSQNKRDQKFKFDGKIKGILNKLLKLGRLKLAIHKNTEKFITSYWINFINFVAKKSGLSVQIIESLRANEFMKVMAGKNINIDVAGERLKGCVLVKRNKKWYFDSGIKYLYWKNRIKSEQNKEITGKVAFPGIAKGKVVLHLSWTDITELNEGDILVTGMTNPQMIPYIKKAGAIVTDEGGITCHAAIIAREMKKPCITGTKKATQILKNGDFVEVDANNGIVKIINN